MISEVIVQDKNKIAKLLKYGMRLQVLLYLEVVTSMKKEFEKGDIKITIDYDKCTGSGECVTVCPVDVYKLVDGKAVAKDVGECIECCACVSACPNDAIEHSSC